MSAKQSQQPWRTRGHKAAMLSMLRNARAIVYRDAESFNEAAAVLEHAGQMLCGEVRTGLGRYKDEICDLARQAPPSQRDRVDHLFNTVRNARNDSVHSGGYIRHHATRLVELLLILEEGLSMSAEIASDLMVQNPITAEPWHNIAAVRRAMLTNSFSFLPAQDTNGEWKLLSDVSVVRYLKHASTTAERNKFLGKQLQRALEKKEIELTACNRFSPTTSIDEITKVMESTPVLIVEQYDGNKERLLGILTAFDLL